MTIKYTKGEQVYASTDIIAVSGKFIANEGDQLTVIEVQKYNGYRIETKSGDKCCVSTRNLSKDHPK